MAVPAIGGRASRPEEASLNLDDELEDLLGWSQDKQLVNRDRTKARQPALPVRPAFQVGNLLATLSTIGCSCPLVGLRMVSGMPR
jgi:hypothetical protein